jgi:hypothetical protein
VTSEQQNRSEERDLVVGDGATVDGTQGGDDVLGGLPPLLTDEAEHVDTHSARRGPAD